MGAHGAGTDTLHVLLCGLGGAAQRAAARRPCKDRRAAADVGQMRMNKSATYQLCCKAASNHKVHSGQRHAGDGWAPAPAVGQQCAASTFSGCFRACSSSKPLSMMRTTVLGALKARSSAVSAPGDPTSPWCETLVQYETPPSPRFPLASHMPGIHFVI